MNIDIRNLVGHLIQPRNKARILVSTSSGVHEVKNDTVLFIISGNKQRRHTDKMLIKIWFSFRT